MHNKQSAPASLSDNGMLHSCQKSELLDVLESRFSKPDVEPQTDAIFIDGSAFIKANPPRGSKTFKDYAAEEIIPKTHAYFPNHKRADKVLKFTKAHPEVRNKTKT